MSEINTEGKQLLDLLLKALQNVSPGNPATYPTYKKVHDQLGLEKSHGESYGQSLQRQGLTSLAQWTLSNGLPAITGLIIDFESKMPGKGHFSFFGKTDEDFEWWKEQIRRSKSFDWSSCLSEMSSLRQAANLAPNAADISSPPKRCETKVYRILRDTQTAARVEQLHAYECQICGSTIVLADGTRYAEAHHIKPLGNPHNGPDVAENVVCLCPNHHVELDYGVRTIDLTRLRSQASHEINSIYANYHTNIFIEKYDGEQGDGCLSMRAASIISRI